MKISSAKWKSDQTAVPFDKALYLIKGITDKGTMHGSLILMKGV